MNIGAKTYTFPTPLGVRDMCHDAAGARHIAVAVSANPRQSVYKSVKSSLWTLENGSEEWVCLAIYDNVRTDALDIWGGKIWLPDQVRDCMLSVDAATGDIVGCFKSQDIDFPHGLAVSKNGKIVMTNYGSSSLMIFDGNTLGPSA